MGPSSAAMLPARPPVLTQPDSIRPRATTRMISGLLTSAPHRAPSQPRPKLASRGEGANSVLSGTPNLASQPATVAAGTGAVLTLAWAAMAMSCGLATNTVISAADAVTSAAGGVAGAAGVVP